MTVRLPLREGIAAFAAVAPFLAKQDDNHALTGALLRAPVIEALDRHTAVRFHLSDALGPTPAPLWVPGPLVEWIAAQKPWKPKKNASPEWWDLHRLQLIPSPGGVTASVVRVDNGEPLADGHDLLTRFAATSADWAPHFPDLGPEFTGVSQVPQGASPAVDPWSVEQIAAWARRWLAEGPGRHPQMPSLHISQALTRAGERAIVKAGPLVAVSLPGGRILK